MTDKLSTSYTNKFFYYLNYVTVEPTMVLYMMAFMTTTVVEQSFYVHRACSVNHGFNKTVCDNLNDPLYTNITKEVQTTTSKFHLWNNIAGHAIPIILALFMGAWSDKRGRKLPLLIGLSGKLLFSLMFLINTVQDDWPVEYIIFSATLPAALTGADLTIFASAFAYLTDVSSVEYRTMRVTILEVCYLAAMPMGIAIGNYLFHNVFNKSFTYMFAINVSIMVAAVLYSALRLEARTNPNQTPLPNTANIFLDFFDLNHLTATIKVYTEKRLKNKRTYLWLLTLMMALYTFQRDEREILFMYCQLVFKWTVDRFSNFKAIQTGLQDAVLLFAIPVMSKLLGWRDTVIVMIGAVANIVARIFYVTAQVPSIFYVGAVFATFGPIVAPVIRSLVSKIVSSSEKGKAFAVLAVADNAVPLISGTCYTTLYKATIYLNPSDVFYLTMVTQMGVFLLIIYIHFKTDRNEFEVEEKHIQFPHSIESSRLKDENVLD